MRFPPIDLFRSSSKFVTPLKVFIVNHEVTPYAVERASLSIVTVDVA